MDLDGLDIVLEKLIGNSCCGLLEGLSLIGLLPGHSPDLGLAPIGLCILCTLMEGQHPD